MAFKNYSLEECAHAIAKLLEEHPHAAVYQKWTCEKCGDRVTGNERNKLFWFGHHEECDHTTDIRKTGCNYAVHYVIGGLADIPSKGAA